VTALVDASDHADDAVAFGRHEHRFAIGGELLPGQVDRA
jgi:hypothetical protein